MAARRYWEQAVEMAAPFTPRPAPQTDMFPKGKMDLAAWIDEEKVADHIEQV